MPPRLRRQPWRNERVLQHRIDPRQRRTLRDPLRSRMRLLQQPLNPSRPRNQTTLPINPISKSLIQPQRLPNFLSHPSNMTDKSDRTIEQQHLRTPPKLGRREGSRMGTPLPPCDYRNLMDSILTMRPGRFAVCLCASKHRDLAPPACASDPTDPATNPAHSYPSAR